VARPTELQSFQFARNVSGHRAAGTIGFFGAGCPFLFGATPSRNCKRRLIHFDDKTKALASITLNDTIAANNKPLLT
jgi:hypothetical protein